MPESNTLARSTPSRRSLLKSAALGSAAAFAAPYVKTSYAAGSLSLGVWDHWVPGANATLTKLCNEWGAKNNCEVKIDYITSQGEKDKLTAEMCIRDSLERIGRCCRRILPNLGAEILLYDQLRTAP